MSDILWIKITTSMFEDEKIRYLESLPDADALIVIWVKLLTLAGKSNAGGYILLTDSIPYTDEMLANQFNRPLNTIRLAMQMYLKLYMVEQTEKGYYVTNWSKHQSVERLDQIKEGNRIRKFQQRERERIFLIPDIIKQIKPKVTDVTPIVTPKVTDNHDVKKCDTSVMSQIVTPIDIEAEVDIDIDKDIVAVAPQKKEKVSFEEYRIYINTLYPDIDCENEYLKFKEWWADGRKELKRPKVAWHNWLDNARKFKNKNNGHNDNATTQPNKDPYWD